jgi:LDH2 family malate/lactate/ureidoglycolate dehydrogenase
VVSEEIVSAAQIRAFAATALGRVGMSNADAAVVADALAWADLHGIDAQGLAKLPLIVARLRAGGNAVAPSIKVVSETQATTVFDVADEWGHVSGVRAMRAAIRKAKTVGVGLGVVRNTSSASAMGYYAMLAAKDDLVGVALNSTYPLMPPWGGTTRVLGNQAFAIGCPSGRHGPLLFDSALSAISWTGIEALRGRGEEWIPEGLALTADGKPTSDPVQALAGILLPMGGHRGYGLALIFEVLTGVLSGGDRFGRDVTNIHDLAQPQGVSHFMLAVDPQISIPLDQFLERVDALIDQMHASPPASGVDRVRVPGERRADVARLRERDGVPFPASRLAALRRLGEDLGVSWEP